MLPFNNRDQYYSQTEVVKKYKISLSKYKKILESNVFKVVQHDLPMGTVLKPFTVTTAYVLKNDIESLQLPLR